MVWPFDMLLRCYFALTCSQYSGSRICLHSWPICNEIVLQFVTEDGPWSVAWYLRKECTEWSSRWLAFKWTVARKQIFFRHTSLISWCHCGCHGCVAFILVARSSLGLVSPWTKCEWPGKFSSPRWSSNSGIEKYSLYTGKRELFPIW